MTGYKVRNWFTEDAWPDDWGDEDLEFLGDFLDDEFQAKLVYDDYGEYDYGLYVPTDE